MESSSAIFRFFYIPIIQKMMMVFKFGFILYGKVPNLLSNKAVQRLSNNYRKVAAN